MDGFDAEQPVFTLDDDGEHADVAEELLDEHCDPLT